ncbi:type II toxin-antitoxin system PemK/MazF family toxin, partial [Acidiphilium sp. PM]
MNRGDIYLVDLEPTAGHEQRGHRPVLVVSPDAFNRLTQCPV